MGPNVVAGFLGAPGTMEPPRARYCARYSSKIASTTMMRLLEMQAWRLLRKRNMEHGAVSARSASSGTTIGSEQPSSSTAGLMASPALAPTRAPAASLPVKVTPRTARMGWSSEPFQGSMG